MPSTERRARESVVSCARDIHDRRLTHGSSGNVSVRCGERILMTGTGVSLGTVTSEELAVIDLAGRHLDGPRPSKEAFLHAAMLRARPEDTAVVHTHSTHSAAVSCLTVEEGSDALPPLTAYFRMRVGELPLLPYFVPGDTGLEDAAEHMARTHRAMLLRNHGPIAASSSLRGALDIIEEIEETAKIFLLIGDRDFTPAPPL